MHNSQNRETSIAFQINNCQFRMLLGFPINEVLQNLRNAETDTWKVHHDTWHLEIKVGDLGSKFKQTKNERRCVWKNHDPHPNQNCFCRSDACLCKKKNNNTTYHVLPHPILGCARPSWYLVLSPLCPLMGGCLPHHLSHIAYIHQIVLICVVNT